MKADSRWRYQLAEDQYKVMERLGSLERWAQAIRAKQQLDAIAGPLTNVAGLWDRIASSAPVRQQVKAQLDLSLKAMRHLQKDAAALEIAQLVASARDEVGPAELALVAYVRRCAAYYMACALREGRQEQVDVLLEDFSVDYGFLQDLISFSSGTEQQAAQELTEEYGKLQQLLNETNEKLRRSTAGTTNRPDALDRARFQAAFLKLRGAFKNIPELRQHSEMAWLPADKYTDETLRAWAKEAIPGFKFSGGRSRKQKMSVKTSP